MLPLTDHLPARRTPVINYLIVAANVLMFLWELSLGPYLQRALYSVAFVPRYFWVPGYLVPNIIRVFISMFLHGGFLHIGSNMLYLWIFGDNVEDRLGHVRYLLFYLLSGYAATLGHFLSSPDSAVPASFVIWADYIASPPALNNTLWGRVNGQNKQLGVHPLMQNLHDPRVRYVTKSVLGHNQLTLLNVPYSPRTFSTYTAVDSTPIQSFSKIEIASGLARNAVANFSSDCRSASSVRMRSARCPMIAPYRPSNSA